MGEAEKIVADKNSAIAMFIETLLSQRAALGKAIRRDSKSLKILSSPAIPEAIRRVERKRLADMLGQPMRRGWTRMDEHRLNWIRGLKTGCYPSCRVAKLVRRFSHMHHYRAALDESRKDQTAAVVFPLLNEAMKAHELLLAEAREISEWESLPVPARFTESAERHYRAVAGLLSVVPGPPAQKIADDGSSAASRKIKPTGKTVSIIRAIELGMDNGDVVDTTGCSVAVARKVRSKLKAHAYEI